MGLSEAVITMVFFPLGMILGLVLVLILRKVKGGGGALSREQEIEQTLMIQDIYHGLQKMEQRIEALETLLLDKERKDKNT